MRKNLIKLSLVFVCLFAFTLLFPGQAKAADHYTIGTGPTFMPFQIQDNKGGYTGKHPGLEIEIFKAIAKKEHFTYTFKPMELTANITALEGNQTDGVLAALMITPERKEKMDFSDSYLNVGLTLAAPTKSKINSWSDLKGKTVAVKAGSTSEAFAESMQKKYGFQLRRFKDSNTELNDVLVGNTVAAVDSTATVESAIKNKMKLHLVGKAYNKNPVAFAVKKGTHKKLLQQFNTGLKAIKADGTYNKIMTTYLGKNSTVTGATKVDRSFIGLLRQNADSFISGITMTIEITVLAIIFATIIGVILGVLGTVPSKTLRAISSTYAFIFKSIPVMVLAFFVYIGLPDLTGQKIPLFIAGVVTITLENSAYTASFVSGGIEAVPSGQMEAARACGMSYFDTMRQIVLPQAVRIMVPSFINQFIIALKGTSVLSAIGVAELTQQGTIIIAKNMEGFKVWFLIAMMYLILIAILTYLSNAVKKHYQLAD
ncbi:ABC transporter substrate-binding protein/permease [Lactobacillus sp. LC28-10]|uniref:ABC transporter substrate-binding protein/permease n=1 Tax=Secundilactobacillus angelensis TaxID=2722706 RepID=A0ABX1KXF9_9LACO|nr:ABC transporter substrate-binding protein/permease [Secundilactobacillus angelensis]MCH5461788.1 ABC transporter substrate-binding protein/permease [Secundilactobacillus angelensis]NLR18627.1 ABC transporter substrate-binding protein/permease [Secundilactobacillus angelensis]